MLELIWGLAQPMLGELVTAAVVILGVFGLWKKAGNDARRAERALNDLNRAKDTVLAHELRDEINEDIAEDTDLAGRARRAGLVRPDGRDPRTGGVR